jgi:hypothetical protein
VQQVSDDFLLNVAEVSATLIGLLLVGVFFYVETGFRRLGRAREILVPYFRAGTRIVLVLYAIPLGVSMTLVTLELLWSRLLFALLSLTLIVANIDTAARIRSVKKVIGSRALFVNEVAGTLGVAALVVVPWLLGGLHPTRGDLTWGILLAFTTGFFSILAIVLSVFDIAQVGDDSSHP